MNIENRRIRRQTSKEPDYSTLYDRVIKRHAKEAWESNRTYPFNRGRSNDDPQEVAQNRVLAEQALASLTPQQRLVVVMKYLDDQTDQDIADKLGIARGTVAATLNQAKKKLKQTISPQD